jgi:hypothetical protein
MQLNGEYLNSKERGLPLCKARIEAKGLIFKRLNQLGVLECASFNQG